MMMPPTIGDYYRSAIEKLKEEVESTPDDRVLGMIEEDWVGYLDQKYGMDAIVFDETREASLVEVERQRVQRGYDIYTDAGPGTVVRSTNVRVEVPVVPSDTIEAIWKLQLAPNTYSIAHGYPEFDYDHGRGLFSMVVSPVADQVTDARQRIAEAVRRYNESIHSESPAFRQQVLQAVRAKVARVKEKHRGLDDLAAAVGIRLTKKVDPATVVQIAPKVRSKIAPVLPPPSKPPTRPVLDAATFNAILDLIDNQCRQFERTPQTFRQLSEEGLRDAILSSLNAVFEGAAGGETFHGIGKVDIHLRIDRGEVFLSELKFWGGPETLREVVGQLRSRLTWREGYGVAIVLSQNAGFSEVLAGVAATLPGIEGFVPGSLQTEAANHFVTRFAIPSDGARLASIHVLVYNLFTSEPGKRMVKRQQ
jgi:hypothetical protein